MPKPKSFEEMVLSARAVERERYGQALAKERGPAPYASPRSEDEQDRMWAYVDPQYADDAAFLLLTAPKEAGGQGLTPLAASYLKYPHRKLLVDGAGTGIDDQIAYANHRRERMQKQRAALPPPPEPTMQPMMQPAP